MNKYRILHLSDVHFGIKDPDAEQPRILAGIGKVIEKFPEQIDLIAFSGDLTQQALPSEFQQGHQWLEKISDLAQAPIIVAPGNHDMKRSCADEDEIRLSSPTHESYNRSKPKFSNKYDHVCNYLSWYAELSDDENRYLDCWAKNNPFIGSHRSKGNTGIPLNVACLNTAMFSCGDDDEGKLCVDISSINGYLETVDVENELVVMVGHHPLDGWMADWNGESFREAVRHATGPHIYLHGHVHENSGDSSYSNQGDGICVIGAGAAYQGSRWKQSFCIVEIDFELRTVTPHTYEYNKVSGAWHKNEAISQSIVANIPMLKKTKAKIRLKRNEALAREEITWNNPFDNATSSAIDAHEIPKLLVDENDFVSRLTNRVNTIVEGQRGTGKTMLLRYLSAEVQFTLLSSDSGDSSSKLDAFKSKNEPVGIYLSLLNTGFDRSDLDVVENSTRRECLFKQRMVLMLIPQVIGMCELLQGSDVSIDNCGRRIQNFLSRTLKKDSLLEAETWGSFMADVEDECNFLIQELNEHISSFLAGGDELFYNTWLTLSGSFFSFLSVIKREFGFETPFFILLDDFDAIGKEEQAITFKIARERKYELVCFKFGVMTLGIKTTSACNGNSFSVGDDYDYIPLAWTDKGLKADTATGNYEKTVIKIAEKRMIAAGWPRGVKYNTLFANWSAGTRIRNEVKERERNIYNKLDPSSKPESFSSYWSKQGNALFLRHLKRMGTTHLYAGRDTVVDISSGIFRQFIELCARITSTALERGWEPRSAGRKKKISTAAQNDAIRAYSKGMLQMLSIGGGDVVSMSDGYNITSRDMLIFTNSLLDLFADKLYGTGRDAEVISISIKDKMIEPSFGKSILNVAVRMSILHRREIDYSSKTGGVHKLPTYLLNRRLAPEKNLGLKIQGRYELSLADVEMAVRQSDMFKQRFSTRKPKRINKGKQNPDQREFL